MDILTKISTKIFVTAGPNLAGLCPVFCFRICPTKVLGHRCTPCIPNFAPLVEIMPRFGQPLFHDRRHRTTYFRRLLSELLDNHGGETKLNPNHRIVRDSTHCFTPKVRRRNFHRSLTFTNPKSNNKNHAKAC